MAGTDQHDKERINEAWNAISRGDSVAPDDDLAREIAHLHGHDDTPNVDSAFASRLLNQLVVRNAATSPPTEPRMNTYRSDTMLQTPVATTHSVRWPRRSPRPPLAGQSEVPRRSAMINLLAIAAVVVLVFGALAADRNRAFVDPPVSGPRRQLAARDANATPSAGAAASTMAQPDAGHTGVMPGPGPTGQPTLAWRHQLDNFGGRSITANNGRIFYVTSTGQEDGSALVAADLTSGDVLWRQPGVVAPDVIGGGGVSATVANGVVYALNAQGPIAFQEDTGNVVWETPIEHDLSVTSLVVADGSVFVVTGSGVVLKLDAMSGERIWDANFGHVEGETTLAAADGMVFGRGSLNGLVFALDADTGETLWTEMLDGGGEATLLVSDGVLATTTIDYDAEERSNPRGLIRLHALEAATGEPLWDPVELTSHASLAAADGTLFVTDTVEVAESLDNTGRVVAYDIRSGESMWTYETGGFLSNPVYVDGQVYVHGRADGTIQRIDASTGTSNWSVYIGAGGNPGNLLVVDGLLVIGANQSIYAVAGGGESGTPAAAEDPVDLSGLPACEPPRTPPGEPLSGDPANTLGSDSRPVDVESTPPASSDIRQPETTNWPLILEANVPGGEPASPEQTDGAKATVAAMADCLQRAGSESEVAGFFSDDFFRRGIVTSISGDALTWISAPIPRDDEEIQTLEVFVLDDGRVAAFAAPPPADAVTGIGKLLVFVEEDGNWLVDEVYAVS